MSCTRVFIVDDHKIFNQAMCSLLKEVQHLEVVGTAESGEEALLKLKEIVADVVLMDISMSGMDGMETTQKLKERAPEVKVILLTMHNQREYVERLKKTWADGYLLKDSGRTELLQAIETVVLGQTYYSPEIMDQLINEYRSPTATEQLPRLTRREKEILSLILDEFTSPQIAAKLYISEQTVLTHRKNLHRKFDVHNTAGLVKKSIQLGFESGG